MNSNTKAKWDYTYIALCSAFAETHHIKKVDDNGYACRNLITNIVDYSAHWVKDEKLFRFITYTPENLNKPNFQYSDLYTINDIDCASFAISPLEC